MTLLRLFPAYRALESLLAAEQSTSHELRETIDQWAARATEIEASLSQEVDARLAIESELESTNSQLLMEQTRRIAAEAIAAERQAEIERLLVSVRDLRDDLRSVTSERIKSVDAINLKLMEAKIPEQPVDFTKHHAPVAKIQHANLVNDIRAKERAMDLLLIDAMNKGFPNRKRTMNQAQAQAEPPVPTMPGEATA